MHIIWQAIEYHEEHVLTTSVGFIFICRREKL